MVLSLSSKKQTPSSPTPTRPPLNETKNASAMSATRTRTLAVSFQGNSFSLQTPKPRKPLVRSLDFGVVLLRKESSETTVSSDSDSVSSGSSRELKRAPLRTVARGVSVPARFREVTSSPRRHVKKEVVKTESSSSSSLGLKRGVSLGGKGKRGEDAHRLRMMHNRYLQWRWVNARADNTIAVQKQTIEENLYNTVMTISEMRDTAALKGIELQLGKQDLKLNSVLKDQIKYLDEWSLIDEEHHNTLVGITEALKATTLRLPIVSGARANTRELNNVVTSAVEVMQATGKSAFSLLSKVEGTNVLVSELAKAAACEHALLAQAKDLLSTVAMLHVKQCSLKGQMLQLNRNAITTQL